MLETKPITKHLPEFKIIKKMFTDLFPRAEVIPIWLLLSKAKNDYVDFLAYYDENVFIGFVYLVTQKNITYLSYIAINPTIQSKGYGSKILNHIKNLYPLNRIILNIEVINENADNNEQRTKRRQFYTKNDYCSSGINIKMGGIDYETLIIGGSCTIEECNILYKKLIGPFLYTFFKPKPL